MTYEFLTAVWLETVMFSPIIISEQNYSCTFDAVFDAAAGGDGVVESICLLLPGGVGYFAVK